jgi:hypothetical protein
LPVFDPVKQVQTMPAFLGNKRRALVSHRASFILNNIWSRV